MAQKQVRTPSYLKFEKGCFYFRTRLPSDFRRGKLKYGDRMSRMLTAFVQKNGWGGGYSFHSFRHAFIAKVDMAKVDGLLKCFVIGQK